MGVGSTTDGSVLLWARFLLPKSRQLERHIALASDYYAVLNGAAMASVFISYSRRDKAFAQSLHSALIAAGHDVWIDWGGNPTIRRVDAGNRRGD